MDVVFFLEADAVRAFKGAEIGCQGSEERGEGGAAEEEGGLVVFGGKGFACFEGACGAGGFGFSVVGKG